MQSQLMIIVAVDVVVGIPMLNLVEFGAYLLSGAVGAEDNVYIFGRIVSQFFSLSVIIIGGSSNIIVLFCQCWKF